MLSPVVAKLDNEREIKSFLDCKASGNYCGGRVHVKPYWDYIDPTPHCDVQITKVSMEPTDMAIGFWDGMGTEKNNRLIDLLDTYRKIKNLSISVSDISAFKSWCTPSHSCRNALKSNAPA